MAHRVHTQTHTSAQSLPCNNDDIRRTSRDEIMSSDAQISLFQFRYDIDTIFSKYRDIDIDIKYVSKMYAFCRLKKV